MGEPLSMSKIRNAFERDAIRSKIKDFRTAIYPRNYHPCTLEKPHIKVLMDICSE